MPAERRYGMDHDHYDWSPLINRKTLRWPHDARIALCVIVNLEHLEWSPPAGNVQVDSLHDRPLPDYRNYSHRDYGHRVGIFRVLDVLEKHGIKPTVAMDVLTAENYPYLVQHCLGRDSEIIGHGVALTRMISSKMSIEEEKEYIGRSIRALTKATGSAPLGWLGPEYGESNRTPQILGEAGIQYVCDWANDEQPYPMKTAKGDLYALPIMLDLDDNFALWERQYRIDEYADLLKEAFDVMYRDAGENGRVLVLNLHPWIIGQPFRIGFLDEALGYMVRKKGVWAASGQEIIDWYSKNQAGT